ncbi:hypothetical protein LUZ60_014878 [Juncus effusus]|nr:hypothetical protein LUZ60_014878 [Juncus effusus]
MFLAGKFAGKALPCTIFLTSHFSHFLTHTQLLQYLLYQRRPRADSLTMALVAETAASAIIGQLVETVLDYANTSWWPSARSVKAEAEKLQAALPQIRLVWAVVQGDRIRQKNPDFDARLWQFRDALEAADDVLDEIKYYELEEKIKARDSEVSGPLSGCKRKLVDFVKNTFVNDGVLGKLREAVKGLEAIASDVGPFLQLANNLNQQLVVNNRETGSFCIECNVVGREKEKEAIVEWLTTQPEGENGGLLSAYSIVGIGGMGKTTLAQLVRNDQRVIEKFDLILWICVSDDSGIVDAKVMIKKIIEDSTKQSCGLDNLNTLQSTLKEKVASKKFLLVLDDVWRDDTMSEWEWQKMVAPLRSGERGSKILVTTRMESVAKMVARLMEEENKYLNLTGLEDNDFTTLFYRHAFAGTDPNKYQHLHEIGDQIAKKLHACPLAAKVIGGLLNNNINYDSWNKISNEDIVNIQESKDYIMDILKLSYYHLPAHLQLCFRYCSIFPQDYIFEKEHLAKRWMALGLIPQDARAGRRPEDVAGEYFDQLARKSFFQLDDKSDQWCRVHDLLHDLARCVSQGECLRITDDVAINIPRTVRHLWIEQGNNCTLREIHNLSKLQTLVIGSIDHDWDEELKFNEILASMKSLRILILIRGEKLFSGKKSKVPSAIGDLIHLRFLVINESWILGEQLRSLYRLYHMEVLTVWSDSDIKKSETEEAICNLVNLRYIKFPREFPWIGKLTSLQKLGCFNVENKTGYKIVELKNLADLRELCVFGLNNINNPNDAKEAKMSTKKNLKSLSLIWTGDHSPMSNIHEDVADNLKPPTNLINLEISYYSSIRYPNWMVDSSCCNLQTVKLVHCNGWEHLPPLGQLNSLERLELRAMHAVKQVGYSLYGNCNGACVFPSLRRLIFHKMSEWEDWIGIDDKLLFPCLEELRIWNCPKLKIIPTLPSSLRILEIHEAGLEALPRLYQVPVSSTVCTSSASLRPSLSYLHVRGCPNIETLIGCPLLQKPEDFHALKEVFITQCINLLHMPVEFVMKLPSLTYLIVSDCPKLVTHEIKLPTMIKSLHIRSCGNLENAVIRSLQDLSSLTRLTMYNCSHIQSLPPKEVFARLKALCHFEVIRCIDLTSLSGIEELTALRTLKIVGCEKLTELSLQQPPIPCHSNQTDFANHHLKLDTLIIDRISLLFMEPLRSLRLTRCLAIVGDSQSTSLPEQWLQQNRLNGFSKIASSSTSLIYLKNMKHSHCSPYLEAWKACVLSNL